ncbi:hypothetical protein [Cellulomonas hominis]|uniref:hypothetical protein n=1 Tax=Cellulomonas hominis TaxID=156981 RepID=UPI0014444698|nr:hypothetical protein [Cellulomonas hominis]NKY08930.1 hypothetical protein [Cellulomonas hominis]
MIQAQLAGFLAQAPVNFEQVTPDWTGVEQVCREINFGLDDVQAASWGRFSSMNIEALVDEPELILIGTVGFVSTAGKRKMLSKKLKFGSVAYEQIREYRPVEHADPRGLGKYGIEFYGAGGIFLGRLQWQWKAKRFGDSRPQIIAVANERDRILSVLQALL